MATITGFLFQTDSVLFTVKVVPASFCFTGSNCISTLWLVWQDDEAPSERLFLAMFLSGCSGGSV